MLQDKLSALQKLRDFLTFFIQNHEEKLPGEHFNRLNELINTEFHYNGWFTKENILLALEGIRVMLDDKDLQKWLSNYNINEEPQRTLGIIMAGNIPMVGFHDFLCAYLTNHKVQIKLSSNDQRLIPFIVDFLFIYDKEIKERISFADKLKNIDALIATGSNNSSRYFKQYFGHIPNIIRKNKGSVAVLNGNESFEELKKLSDDIFFYFGLGCRNVSKILVPLEYDFDRLFEAVYDKRNVIEHNKYANNYEYNRAVFLLNKEPILDNGFLLLKKDKGISSPVAVLYYDYYNNIQEAEDWLQENKDKIQCVVAKNITNALPFGQTQFPRVFEYADGIDTMAFLCEI